MTDHARRKSQDDKRGDVRELPFCVALPRTTSSNDFIWGRHHRACLRAGAKAAGLFENRIDKNVLARAMESCGYRNSAKFQRQRHLWNRGEGRIPRAYLGYIGCSLDTLADCVALDQREYEKALRTIPRADRFLERIAPTVWRAVAFPEPVHEIDAVHLIRLHQGAQRRKRDSVLTWPSLKTVFVPGNGPVTTGSFQPEINFGKDHCTFSYDGSTGFGLRV
jgi:hypothetical protein